MLYIFENIDSLSDDFSKRCIPYLSTQRIEKVFSYRFPLDRNLSATVYLLLRFALKVNYGIDEPVVFAFGKNGKPFLRDYPQIYFNLSHCNNAAACAVSSGEIGVDVQEVTPVSDDLAGRVLTTEEFGEFKAAENPSLQFCEYWVMKESWLKKTGQGICRDLNTLPSESLKEKTLVSGNENYCCCAAGDFVLLRYVSTSELTSYTRK